MFDIIRIRYNYAERGMNLRLTKRSINSKNPDYKKIKALYDSSFERNAHPSFRKLSLRAKKENVAFEAYYLDGKFCGLACIVFNDDAVYIQCISIAGRYRSKGIGSAVVSDIKNRAQGRPVFAEVERHKEESHDNARTLKTLEFFAKNGFCDTGFSVKRKQKMLAVISDSYGFTAEKLFEICNGYSMGFYSPEITVNR